MPTFNLPRTKNVPSAKNHNHLIDAVRSLDARTSAGASFGSNTTGGPSVALYEEDDVLGIITGGGGGQPYQWSWAAVQSGSFSPYASGISNAFEINGRQDVPAGHAVTLYPGFASDRLFQVIRLGTPPPPCCLIPCNPCVLPQKDLELAFSNTISGNGTIALNFNGALWQSECSNGLTYELVCSSNQTTLSVTSFDDDTCDSAEGSCASNGVIPSKLDLGASTCNPLSLTYNVVDTDCPVLSGLGYTSFVVSDPSPAAPSTALMCQTVCVTGGCSVGASDVTISQNGQSVASAQFPEAGVCASLSWPGTPGMYTITTVGGTFTKNLECGGTTNIQAPIGWSSCVGNTNNIQFSCDLEPGGPQHVSFDLVWDAANNQWFGEQDVTLLITVQPLVMPLSVRLFGDSCEADISLCVTSSPEFTAITLLPASSCSPFQLVGVAQSASGCMPPDEPQTIFAQNIVMTQ
jgi:hypothetical protein